MLRRAGPIARRFGPPALVGLLIASTAVAFAKTESLKLQRWPITHTRVSKHLSPTCRCDTKSARISFRLRKNDRLTVEIVDSDGDELRRLADDKAMRHGLVQFAWDGRDDSGLVAAEGAYQVRVHLKRARGTITLPNLIRLDRTPPRATLVSASPLTISPDGDRRADAVHIRFKLSEKGWGLLYVDGRLAVKARMKTRKIDWRGTVRGRVSEGVHRLRLSAMDRAGNVAPLGRAFVVEVRILELEPKQIGVLAGKRFSVSISSDRRRVHWRFAGRDGIVRGKRLSLTAPAEPGEYWLLLDSGPFEAGARVNVF